MPFLFFDLLQSIQRFLPTVSTVEVVTIPMLVAIIVAVVLASFMKRKKTVRTAYTRKTFHFIIFSFAGILQYYFGLKAVTFFGCVVTCIILVTVAFFDRTYFYRALARESDAPHQKKFILFPLFATALGGVLSNLFFPATAYIGYFVGGWGDAAGEPVGTMWGRHKYSVPTMFGVRATRSIEGSAAVLCVSFVIAFICLIHTSSLTLSHAFIASLVCSIAVVLVEAISSHGLDNLTIQLCAAGIIEWMIRR